MKKLLGFALLLLFVGGGVFFWQKNTSPKPTSSPSPSPKIVKNGFGRLIKEKYSPWRFVAKDKIWQVFFSSDSLRFSFECPKSFRYQTSNDREGYRVKFFTHNDLLVFSLNLVNKSFNELLNSPPYRYLKGEPVEFNLLAGRLYKSLLEGKKEEWFYLFPYPREKNFAFVLVVSQADSIDTFTLLNSFKFD